MFIEKIDWKNPRFKKWNLKNLAPLNQAQQAAFFEDDEIDFPDFSEAELKAIALKFPCRVELFHSNVCYGVEKSWPNRLFGVSKFQDLWPHQKHILIRTMSRDGVKLYNKYVDENRLKRRREQQTNLALAQYYQERFLRNRFIRIRALGNYAGYIDSDSSCSIVTVIDKSKRRNATLNASAPAGGPNDNVAGSSIIDGNVMGKNRNKLTRQCVKPSVDVFSASTRSKRRAANSKPKASIKAPPQKPLNKLVSSGRVRKLRTNLPQNSHDDGNMLFLNHKDFPTGDDGIAMLVEVSNPMNIPNDANAECQINMVEHIDITDDSPNDSSDTDGLLIIDERFNDDTLSQSTELSSISNRAMWNISPPRMNSSEFVRVESLDIRYMHASFNESIELFLSQTNTQIE